MKKILFAISLLFVSIICLSVPAHADALADAKVAGQVGEMPDGYLGLVSTNPSTSVRSVVENLNAKRKAEYQKIAAKNGQAQDVVEKLAGERNINKTASGNYVMGDSGKWIKK